MLKHLRAAATRLLVEEDGQALSEYALLLFIVSIAAVALLALFGSDVHQLLNIAF